ncbi:MAG: class I SAM-dependent methyltransferase [Hyphomicrobiaceae bacterium]
MALTIMNEMPVNSIGAIRADDLPSADGAAAYVSNFYSLMNQEMAEADFTPTERRSMEDPVLYYGRYLNPSTRPYFEETVIPVIGTALMWFRQQRLQRVLDLGCGLAMQSIILAALGKTVVAVDLRPESIELGKKRKRYYEEILGRELAIEFICGDFLKLDWSRYDGQIDGVFSMSAFSYIQPFEDTVSLVARLSSEHARVFLFEENSANIVARMFRRRPVPEPSVVADQFGGHGFAVQSLKGTCALPKQLWVYPSANGLVRNVDQVARKSMQLAFSYALMMERQDRPDF